jgi:bacteriorhodopsin
LSNENKELQIKLALLQTDIQTYLTINVSLIAITFALIISFQQLSAQATETWKSYLYIVSMIAMAVISYLITKVYTDKIKEKRKEMEELKKQYLW